jgi:hypothetical protein
MQVLHDNKHNLLSPRMAQIQTTINQEAVGCPSGGAVARELINAEAAHTSHTEILVVARFIAALPLLHSLLSAMWQVGNPAINQTSNAKQTSNSTHSRAQLLAVCFLRLCIFCCAIVQHSSSGKYINSNTNSDDFVATDMTHVRLSLDGAYPYTTDDHNNGKLLP